MFNLITYKTYSGASDAEGCRRRRQYRTGRAHHGATAREGMSEANL
jgi:hypothetical protein